MRAARALAATWLLLLGLSCLLPGVWRVPIAAVADQALSQAWGTVVADRIILAAARSIKAPALPARLAVLIDRVAGAAVPAPARLPVCPLPQRTTLHLLALAWWLGALYPLAVILAGGLVGAAGPDDCSRTSTEPCPRRAAARATLVLATLMWSASPDPGILLAPAVAWLWISLQPEPSPWRLRGGLRR